MAVTERSVEHRDVCRWVLTARSHDIEHWRRAVADAMALWGAPSPSVEVARLGVSELLGNVVKHAGPGSCRLQVERSCVAVVVRVADRSPVHPVIRRPAWDAESGRGLWLLREMADGFGCLRHVWDDGVVGKSMWFACRWDETGPVPAEAGAPVGATRESNYRIRNGELP